MLRGQAVRWLQGLPVQAGSTERCLRWDGRPCLRHQREPAQVHGTMVSTLILLVRAMQGKLDQEDLGVALEVQLTLAFMQLGGELGTACPK